MAIVLDAALLATGCVHVLLAPYTKVEESFNLHATHDVLTFGIAPSALANYDHFIFPSPVPRTFVGSVVLAYASKPVIWAATHAGLVQSGVDVQVLLRLVLATANALGLCAIQRVVSRRFGRLTALFFVLLTISQFQLPFWMGRTLPNMFALPLVNMAIASMLERPPGSTQPSKRSVERMFALLTFAGVVFRAEVALLLAPLCIQYLLLRYVSFSRLVKIGLKSAFVSLALTVAVDTYFHASPTPIWPEFAGIYFNVVQGKSAEWGVEPAHAYFTRYLPKALMSSVVLWMVGAIADSRVRTFMLPTLAFLLLISGLGHKEWRFVVYVIPIFNVAAAKGLRWFVSKRKGTIYGRLLFAAAFGVILLQLGVTSWRTGTSIANYPGGEAMRVFHEHYANTSEPVSLHICNLAAQTGASLFTQERGNWRYSKEEGLSVKKLAGSGKFTHLIAEAGGHIPGAWRTTETIFGYGGNSFSMPAMGKMRGIASIKRIEQLVILERRT
ncbi:glycosyltransferase family 22 protein [Cylindrobasidium torrendii FP15055 ss-10]|uniref:Mannosyltransferase n=1 Tax=Cylindrobasidium torrendii FP15055 ss-10 TaxID=1314674 RepID=A0A0D7BPI3_9AGAR|nr:glycosyltransferase family 22 protein [Cylindrobasidium torrendii FP15055 ss-10]